MSDRPPSDAEPSPWSGFIQAQEEALHNLSSWPSGRRRRQRQYPLQSLQQRHRGDADEAAGNKHELGDAGAAANADVVMPLMTPAVMWSSSSLSPPRSTTSQSASTSSASSLSSKTTSSSTRSGSTTNSRVRLLPRASMVLGIPASTLSAVNAAPVSSSIPASPPKPKPPPPPPTPTPQLTPQPPPQQTTSPRDRTPLPGRVSRSGPTWGWRWFRSELFCALAVFAPVAIAAGALHWPPRVVFALSALSLTGLEVLISTALERVCLAHAGQSLLAAACLEIIPNVFPTMIGIVALAADESSVAKSFVIGNVLNNILLGTGLSLFIGGFRPDYEAYAQHVSDTAFELIKLIMISTSPVVIAWAMIYVMTSRADHNTTTSAIRGLSRGTALILLAVYLFWVLFRRVTHRSLFAADDLGRQAAATAVQRRGGAWPLRADKPRWKKEHDDGKPPNRRWSTADVALVVTLVVALVAAFVAAIFCCHYLVANIDELVEEPELEGLTAETDATASSSSLHRHFVASILLPLIVNLYSDVRAAELASCGGGDVSLAVHLTYGAGASSILLTLPVLVVVGWAADRPLLLDFAAFDVSILAGSVWATSILTTTQVDYFRGFVFLCLYAIVALAVFLFKE